MRSQLRSISLLALTGSLLACGGDPVSSTDDAGPSGDCTCTVTIDEDTQEMVCGESRCVGSFDDDRWVTCTESGPMIGSRVCIVDQWDATSPSPFDCDGRQTCPADTYCVVRAGEVPRQTECRPYPAGCTPPTTTDTEFCNCFEPDALSSGVCSGSPGVVSCDRTEPRHVTITCGL